MQSIHNSFVFIDPTLKTQNSGSLIDEIQKSREAKSIMDFKFNMKRIQKLNQTEEVSDKRTGGIAYWMSRDQRIQGWLKT